MLVQSSNVRYISVEQKKSVLSSLPQEVPVVLPQTWRWMLGSTDVMKIHHTLLPILDDAHKRTSWAHIQGLSNIFEELFLDLKAALANAPAAIYQEG